MLRTGLIVVILSVVGTQVALGQAGTVQFDAVGKLTTDLPFALPSDTARDLYLVGKGQFSANKTIAGFSQPLSDETYNAAKLLFDQGSEFNRRAGEALLKQQVFKIPEAGIVLGAGYQTQQLGTVAVDAALDQYIESAKMGDPLAQQLVNNTYFDRFVINPNLAGDLEAAFKAGLNPQVGPALALKYQWGLGGVQDFEKADFLWKQVILDGNPSSLYDYGQFLVDSGRPEQAAQYFRQAAASDFSPAIVKSFDLAWREGRANETASLLPRLELNAQDEREVAVMAGDYHRSLGTPDERRKAMGFYELSTIATGGADIFMARGKSRIAELILEDVQFRSPGWEARVRQLFAEAAVLGDAGGFLGQARLAQEQGAYQEAYGLASRAAELGNEGQVEEARKILAALCQPEIWDQGHCAPVPVFFVTTRKSDPSGQFGFSGNDSEALQANFGIAFVQIPILSHNFPAREMLFRAGKAAVEHIYGAEGLARLTGDMPAVFRDAPRDAWTDALRQAAIDAGQDDAFAFVHGYNVAFDAAIRGTAETVEKAGYPSIPVALSWPSEGDMFRYGQDAGRVDMACPRLFEGLKALGSVFPGSKLTLMAHSMGSRVVYKMVIGCDQAPESAWPIDPVNNLIYAAPDMPRFSFEEKLDFMASRVAHLTLYVTSNDAALALSSSSAFNATIRAGQLPADRGPVTNPKLVTIDATEVEAGLLEAALTGEINHGYVFSRPQAIADLSQLLNSQFDLSARTCLKSAGANPDYERIRKDCPLPDGSQ